MSRHNRRLGSVPLDEEPDDNGNIDVALLPILAVRSPTLGVAVLTIGMRDAVDDANSYREGAADEAFVF